VSLRLGGLGDQYAEEPIGVRLQGRIGDRSQVRLVQTPSQLLVRLAETRLSFRHSSFPTVASWLRRNWFGDRRGRDP